MVVKRVFHKTTYIVGFLSEADINSAFEHIVNRVMEPLGKFASSIASEYQNAATGIHLPTCFSVPVSLLAGQLSCLSI